MKTLSKILCRLHAVFAKPALDADFSEELAQHLEAAAADSVRADLDGPRRHDLRPLACAFVAGYLPARRAWRVDPLVALRPIEVCRQTQRSHPVVGRIR